MFDWNSAGWSAPATGRGVRLHDETLRDGIQKPSGVDPTIEEKIEIVHLLDKLGVGSVNVGLPGAGPRAMADVLTLCREIADNGLSIRPGCAGRTVISDLAPIVEVSQRVGIEVEVLTFIGSSPIRQLAESWSVDLIRKRSAEAISFAVGEGLPTTYVTEDTTRSHPRALYDLFRSAIDQGVSRLCLCDTVGHATPDGTRNVVRFTRDVIEGAGVDVGIDWHGHNDRGFALGNSLRAMECGADRLHGCVVGIGERVGNTPLDLLLVSLTHMGLLGGQSLDALPRLCQLVSEATAFDIPSNYPLYRGEGPAPLVPHGGPWPDD